MKKQLSKRFSNESVMRNFAEFTRKHLCRNPFPDKAKLCRSSTLLKTSLQRRCFLVNFAKFLKTSFLESTTRRLLLIIAVSIVVKEELTKENLNHGTKTKAYVPISARSVSYQKGQSRQNLYRFQKQSFADVLQNRCSLKFRRFHRKTPALEILIN